MDFLADSHRIKWWESIPWITAAVIWLWYPSYLPFGVQIITMILFVLSYDIVVGYAGIVILGHTAFYGVGAYAAGLLAVWGWGEPISGLLAAGAAAGLVGVLAGVVILRTTGLTLLMLGLALTLLLKEAANRFSGITGGHDGLQGISIDPIFGVFEFDFFARTSYVYSIVILFICWLFVRSLVISPFGRSLVGIRLNPTRMAALGVPIGRRMLIAFTISAMLAGIAGGLSAQTTQFVSLNVFGLDLAGAVLVMLVLGGRGKIYGAFAGTITYLILQDYLAKDDPVYWLFWIGLIIVLIVLIAPGGLIGILEQGIKLVRQRFIPRASTTEQNGMGG